MNDHDFPRPTPPSMKEAIDPFTAMMAVMLVLALVTLVQLTAVSSHLESRIARTQRETRQTWAGLHELLRAGTNLAPTAPSPSPISPPAPPLLLSHDADEILVAIAELDAPSVPSRPSLRDHAIRFIADASQASRLVLVHGSQLLTRDLPPILTRDDRAQLARELLESTPQAPDPATLRTALNAPQPGRRRVFLAGPTPVWTELGSNTTATPLVLRTGTHTDPLAALAAELHAVTRDCGVFLFQPLPDSTPPHEP